MRKIMANSYTKIVTPVGVAQFPWLTTADTKFGEPGDYKVNLVIKKEDCGAIIHVIDEVVKESLTLAKEKSKSKTIKQANPPYNDELDDEGNPTGNVIFKFKCKSVVTMKTGETFENRPAIFDAKGIPLKDVNVWGGSELKVSSELIPYYTSMVGAGVSMRLKGVQVIKLVEGGSDSSGHGFKKEEGYTASETQEFDNETQPVVAQEDDF